MLDRASDGVLTPSRLMYFFFMVNVPFLLGVWDWTVQPFCRR
jgi:hypothetical protein